MLCARVRVGINKRHRMAQHASMASVALHTLYFFSEMTVIEEAYVTEIMANAFLVLIPKYARHQSTTLILSALALTIVYWRSWLAVASADMALKEWFTSRHPTKRPTLCLSSKTKSSCRRHATSPSRSSSASACNCSLTELAHTDTWFASSASTRRSDRSQHPSNRRKSILKPLKWQRPRSQ